MNDNKKSYSMKNTEFALRRIQAELQKYIKRMNCGPSLVRLQFNEYFIEACLREVNDNLNLFTFENNVTKFNGFAYTSTDKQAELIKIFLE